MFSEQSASIVTSDERQKKQKNKTPINNKQLKQKQQQQKQQKQKQQQQARGENQHQCCCHPILRACHMNLAFYMVGPFPIFVQHCCQC